ncbi:MAG: ferredoxin [Deltaproteobacteria bacterium]|nr:ferredoxin [Deltaproteobacteria bacterium]
MIQITIDREACIGASACVAAAGKTFALDAEGKSTVVNAQGDSEEEIRAAAAGCPTGAIQLEEVASSKTEK